MRNAKEREYKREPHALTTPPPPTSTLSFSYTTGYPLNPLTPK